MLEPIFRDAIIFASLLTLLGIGLTLTYMTTKVPNFAHGSFATIGIYVALTASKILNNSPYFYLPVAFMLGSLAALALYMLILKPLTKRGASLVSLMIATLAFDLLLLAFINIYADYLTRVYKVTSRLFLLRSMDFRFYGEPALLLIAPSFVVGLITVLYFILNKTKFGIAMRATIENPPLAGVLGINVNLVYATSWFISGGLAGLSGCLVPLWYQGNPDWGTAYLASIFAASIVGGFFNIYGAALGGYLVGLSEVLGTTYLARNFGSWIHGYRSVIPLSMIIATLMIAPRGLTGIDWSSITKKLRGRLFGSTG